VWPGTTVELARVTLHVRRAQSDGMTAVLVHGLGGSATNWTDLMAGLVPELDLHAVDLPGHGHSPASRTGRYDLDTHCAAVIAYIEHVGAPVHLFGNSTGGAIATRIAATRPELVRTLTLVSPALPVYRMQRSSDPRLAALLVPGLGEALARRLDKADPETQVRRTLELCFGDFASIPPQRLAEAQAEGRRRASTPWATAALVGTLRGLVRTYFERGSRALWAQAAQVQAPTLVIFGARDRLVPVSVGRRAARTFPSCRLVVLPGVGHVAQMESPERVVALVRGHVGDGEKVSA
jgi:pimeloyl-ACP methyl ester carboxylesterase